MGKRITIVLDDDLVKKLHEIQAKLIRESEKSVSFSHVLNVQVRNSLKK
jgi:predicted transcriptional regulator